MTFEQAKKLYKIGVFLDKEGKWYWTFYYDYLDLSLNGQDGFNTPNQALNDLKKFFETQWYGFGMWEKLMIDDFS